MLAFLPFHKWRDNETEYDSYYSIYPAAIFTLNWSDYFMTSLGLEHKKIYNSNPEVERSIVSFNGGSVNISARKDFNFIFQTSYFDGIDFKNNEVVLRSLGFGLAFFWLARESVVGKPNILLIWLLKGRAIIFFDLANDSSQSTLLSLKATLFVKLK